MTKHIFLPERFSAPLTEAERSAELEQSTIGREFLALTPGKHTAYAWCLFPYKVAGEQKVSAAALEHFAEQILEKWREYAPNMTRENVLGQYIYTADTYSQEFINMRYGDIFMGALTEDQVLYNYFGYRTPIEGLYIEGLYMAGSATHPNGAISGGAGYIVFSLIANDLDIKPWWRPVDVREAIEHLA